MSMLPDSVNDYRTMSALLRLSAMQLAFNGACSCPLPAKKVLRPCADTLPLIFAPAALRI